MTQMTVGEVRRKDVAGAATATSAPEVIGRTACETCGQVNLSTRRFCSACGKSLWSVCPGCGAEGPVSDAFCGTCGVSLRDIQRRQADRHRATLQEARQLLAEHRYEDAKWRLQSLVKPEDDQTVSQEAVALLERLDADRRLAEEQAAEAHRQARELCERQRYDEAVQWLMSVPATLRDGDMQALAERRGPARPSISSAPIGRRGPRQAAAGAAGHDRPRAATEDRRRTGAATGPTLAGRRRERR